MSLVPIYFPTIPMSKTARFSSKWLANSLKVDKSKLVLKSSINYENSILMEKFKKNGLEKRIKIYERSEFSNVKDHLDFLNTPLQNPFIINPIASSFEIPLWLQ